MSQKDEKFQFFGSGVEKCKEVNLLSSTFKHQNLGPGTYDAKTNFTSETRKLMASTACFLNRKEANLFGVIEGLPAPTDYEA